MYLYNTTAMRPFPMPVTASTCRPSLLRVPACSHCPLDIPTLPPSSYLPRFASSLPPRRWRRLFDRHIHSALQMTLRPMKDTNGEVIRSAPGDFPTSFYIICSAFRKSGFVLRRKYVELFSSAYLKISTASNILDCLVSLRSFSPQ